MYRSSISNCNKNIPKIKIMAKNPFIYRLKRYSFGDKWMEQGSSHDVCQRVLCAMGTEKSVPPRHPLSPIFGLSLHRPRQKGSPPRPSTKDPSCYSSFCSGCPPGLIS